MREKRPFYFFFPFSLSSFFPGEREKGDKRLKSDEDETAICHGRLFLSLSLSLRNFIIFLSFQLLWKQPVWKKKFSRSWQKMVLLYHEKVFKAFLHANMDGNVTSLSLKSNLLIMRLTTYDDLIRRKKCLDAICVFVGHR